MAGITDDKEFNTYLKSTTPLVVKFFSLWDGASRNLEDSFREIAKDFGGRARFMQSNINSNPEIAQEFQISKIPTIAVFHSGKLIMRITSFPSKRAVKEQLENILRSLQSS